jgi:hypothetical protein
MSRPTAALSAADLLVDGDTAPLSGRLNKAPIFGASRLNVDIIFAEPQADDPKKLCACDSAR